MQASATAGCDLGNRMIDRLLAPPCTLDRTATLRKWYGVAAQGETACAEGVFMAGRRVRVLLVTLLVVAGGMPAILGAQALEAAFADLKGEVQWSPAGSTQWAAASANTVLHSGDRVRTSVNSSARLAFFEGSTVDLGATTGIRLDAVRQGDDESQVQVLQTA